jgi:hypothetical protein
MRRFDVCSQIVATDGRDRQMRLLFITTITRQKRRISRDAPTVLEASAAPLVPPPAAHRHRTHHTTRAQRVID